MSAWTTIIIDDEQLARTRLRRLLAKYDDLKIVAEAENGLEGLALIHQHRPQLIFLDIEMPVLSGFEMLAKLEIEVKVIFTTAYNQYAIRAFEEDSIDYLLKPIELLRLDKTIAKLRASHFQPQSLALQELIETLRPKNHSKTISVKIGDRILLVKVSELTHIAAEDKYVFLHANDQKRYLVDLTLSALEKKLEENFIRVNRAVLINPEHILEIRKGFNGAFVFILDNAEGTKITSTRSYAETIKTRFEL